MAKQPIDITHYEAKTMGTPPAKSRAAISISWADAPWLTEESKQQIRDATPIHLRATVEFGTFAVGEGSIYPIAVEDIIVPMDKTFKIPDHWRFIYGMDVGWNRCLAADSMVLMVDGTQKAIQDIVVGEQVLAFDFKSENLVPTKVIDTFKGRASNMVTVGISEEQTITCTDDHPFAHRAVATDAIKFKKIRDINTRIREFQSVVLPSRWNITEGQAVCSSEMARIIGYLLGDGCLTYTNRRLEFAQVNPVFIDDMRRCLESVGCKLSSYADNTKHFLSGQIPGNNAVLDYVRELGLLGTDSSSTFVPTPFFTASEEVVANLLTGLVHTDGFIEGDNVRYYTVSKALAEGVKTLCLRLGIYASISKDSSKRKETHLQVYRVTMRRPTCLPLLAPKALVPTRSEIKMRADRLLTKYEAAPEQDIYCITVEHPDHAFVCNGFVVSNTAVAFLAQNPDTGVWYLYDEYYGTQQPPPIHADRIKEIAKDWMVGVIDPASKNKSQIDGEQLLNHYRRLGLKLRTANNSIEFGITKVWSLLASGKLKVFASCYNFLNEYALYRREKGVIVKKDDHLMDALRYGVVEDSYARPKASYQPEVAGIRGPLIQTKRKYGSRRGQ